MAHWTTIFHLPAHLAEKSFPCCSMKLRITVTASSRIVTSAATQPTGLPSCGSTFRNPPGDYAARLIEACGLKGFRIGGAEVSAKHANFLINTGDATADDIERLMRHVRETVEQRHGVRLQTEVHTVGDPA